MAIQIEFQTSSQGDDALRFPARVQLERDPQQLDRGTWKQLPYRNGALAVNPQFPGSGIWCKDDGTNGTVNGSIWLAPQENHHFAILILDAVFPAATGRTGMGYFNYEGTYALKGRVKFSVVSGEQVTSAMPNSALAKVVPLTDPRVQKAWCIAIDDLKSQGYLEQRYVEFLKNPMNWAMIAAFWGLNSIKSKAGWFLAAKACAGQVLLMAAALKYGGEFQAFYNAAQSATTDAEIEAAGHMLGKILGNLIVDISVAAFCAVLDGMMKARGTPPRETPAAAAPKVNMREWKRLLPEMYSLRDNLRLRMREAADPATYAQLAARAMNCNIAIKSLSRHILDTVHHIDMVKKAGAFAADLITKAGREFSGGGRGPLMGLLKNFTAGEFQLTGAELEYVANVFTVALQKAKGLKMELDFHDFNDAITSKFSRIVAKALSSPMQVPRGATLKQLEALAEGKHPDSGAPATAADYESILGKEWMDGQRKLYTSDAEIASVGYSTKNGIIRHNSADHHAVETMTEKPLALLLEMGVDVAHGWFYQLRHYRDGAADIAKALEGLPEWKRAWVKIGIACMEKLSADIGRNNVTDPLTVSTSTLAAYGQSGLSSEFRHVLHPSKRRVNR